jgi:hypothetical protein
LRDGDERGSADLGDGATGIEGHGKVGGGDTFREVRDGENVERIFGEEGFFEPAAKGFNGSTNCKERIKRIFHERVPSGAGETDLMRKTAHDQLFLGGGVNQGLCSLRVREEGVKGTIYEFGNITGQEGSGKNLARR